MLAAVYTKVGDYAAALPLATEGLAANRRLNGNDKELTLVAISGLASLHAKMGNRIASLPLHQEALERSRRINGDSHRCTLAFMGNVAGLHLEMGNFRLALPLATERLKLSRRLLGNLNPGTLQSVGNLAIVFANMGNCSAALPLLEECVAGYAQLGKDHPQIRFFKNALQQVQQVQRASTSAHAAACTRQQRRQKQGKPVAIKAHLTTTKVELNGKQVQVIKFNQDKQRYIILLLPSNRKSLCSPASLVLVAGTPIIVAGLTQAPELNGSSGVVEAFEKGRYSVRLEGRATLVGLRPETCLAAVSGASQMIEND